MKSRIEARARAGGRSAKRRPVPGGKALQRLFAYLGQRHTALGNAVLASMPVAKAARPAFGLSARAKAAPVLRVLRRKPASSAAKSFAGAIAKAADKLSRGRRRAGSGRAARNLGNRAAIARAMAPAPLPPGTAGTWQSIGPTRIPNGQTYGSNSVDVIGRVSSIAVDPADKRHVLCGAAGGGIWESTDAGANWLPRTDQMPSLAIGAIAFDPRRPNVVYAGSGEGNFYWNLGAGIYQSTDGGTTWKVLASSPFVGNGFFELVVDPRDGRLLYAGTMGGFYSSTDGGLSWTLRRAGKCWDISLDPAGGKKAEILATFADGLFVSTSGGATFSAVALPGAPSVLWDRLAVDRCMASPDVAYAFGAAGGSPYLWRRAGTTWTRITALPSPAINITQAWYDWYVAVPPADTRVVYLGAIDAYRGVLSGSTWGWTDISTQGSNSIHPDQHCLAFAPSSPNIIYAGNDGGAFRSSNGGATWTALNRTLAITEIEYMALDPGTPDWLMAGTQDNGTIAFKGAPTWDHIADGDGGDCGVNQFNPDEIYHSYYGVQLYRSANKGGSWTNVAPPAMSALFYPPVEVFGTTVAMGGALLDVSRNSGTSWTQVSLGLPTGDVASAMEIPDTNTIFVGTMQGRMLKIVWNGSSWVKGKMSSPASRYISCISADPGTPARLWVTLSGLGGGRVYRSDNAGASWKDCSAGLPVIPMNSVAIDPANGKRVWVAADVGVYQTTDLGATWASFSNGLPNAMAVDLVFHKKARVLFCGTRNRGAWFVNVP